MGILSEEEKNYIIPNNKLSYNTPQSEALLHSIMLSSFIVSS